MNKNVKIGLAALLVCIVSVTTTYAVMTTVYEFQGTGTIAGIGVQVRYNVDEAPGELVTSINFGTVYQEPVYSPFLVICGDCNYMEELVSLSNDLDPSVGTLIWEIEYDNDIGSPDDWAWIEYDPTTNPDLKGGANRPLGTGYVGFYDHPQPGAQAWRHLRLKFKANPDAPLTEFTFTITVTGTEVA